MRRKDINRLLVNVVAIAIVLFGILTVAVPARAQTSQAAAKEAIVLEIKEYAERHANNDTSMQTEFIANLYRDNKVGLTLREIATIYETEYDRLKKAKRSNIWEQLYPYGGWIAALISILFSIVVLVFQTIIRESTSSSIEKICLSFYDWYVGTLFFDIFSLKQYRETLQNKYRELRVPFRPNPLQMQDVYVPLKVAETSDTNKIDAREAVKEYRKLMVKGPPGSGKSMLLKHLALSYADGTLPLGERPIAILLELQGLNYSQKSLADYLAETLSLNKFPNAQRFVEQGLKRAKLVLLLDGLDEVSGEKRPRVVREIWKLLEDLDFDRSRVIITCRTAIYKAEFDDRVDRTLEVVEFNQGEIRKFLQSWRDNMPEGKSVEQLMKRLQGSPQIMTLAPNPLMLTIIACLYTTENSFELPRSRGDFYQKATETLNGDNKYEAIDKRSVLQDLALYFQDNANSQEPDDPSVDRLQVFGRVKKQLRALGLDPDKDVKELLNEIVDRSGLLLRIDGGDRYQFAHFTLQEFFAAAALSAEELLDRFENKPDSWRETAKLWCGLAEDSTRAIERIYAKDSITAFECLADAQKVNQELAAQIIDTFKERLSEADRDDRVTKAFAAVAADNRPRGRAAFEFLEELIGDENPARRAVAAQTLSLTNLPDAVGVLAKHYHERSEVGEYLVRMGDLAVSVLKDLSAEGSERAMDALVAIGTPDAAEALVPLLWNADENLAARAAWRLAGLLPQPNVEGVLGSYPIAEEYKKTERLKWIWEPFNEPGDSALPIIAGRVAYLISEVPVELVDTTSLPALTPKLMVPISSIQLIGEIEVAALERFKKAIDELEGGSVEPGVVDRRAELVTAILADAKAGARWRSLLRGQTPTLQFDLLRRLSNYRLPAIDDWRNVFRPVEYDFRKGWHYRVILSVATVFSVVALAEMIYPIYASPQSWTGGFKLMAIFAVVHFLVFLCNFRLDLTKKDNGTFKKTVASAFIPEEGFFALEPDLFLSVGLLGTMTFFTEWHRLVRKRFVGSIIMALTRALPITLALIGAVTGAAVGFRSLAATLVGLPLISYAVGWFNGKTNWGMILTSALLIAIAESVAVTAVGFRVLVATVVGASLTLFAVEMFNGKTRWGMILTSAFLIAVAFSAESVADTVDLNGVLPTAWSVVGVVAGVLAWTTIGTFMGAIPAYWAETFTKTKPESESSDLHLREKPSNPNPTASKSVSFEEPNKIFGNYLILVAIVAFFAGRGSISTWSLAAALVGLWFAIVPQSVGYSGGILAVLAAPLFCWLPIVAYFATIAMLNVLSWQQTALVWLTSIAICTILWFIGKKRDREARNPLHGILPYKTISSNDK